MSTAKSLPAQLSLSRVSVRAYGNDLQVALYFCDEIEQFFTVTMKTERTTKPEKGKTNVTTNS